MIFTGALRRAFLAAATLLVLNVAASEAENKAQEIVPTHADAALVFAKYTGLFERYIPEDAPLGECVSFLNGVGIYFGMLDVVNGSEFSIKDCARVMGQMNLLFSGEAQFVAGKVALPNNVDSWQKFCILNNVDYVQGYRELIATLTVLNEK